MAKPVKLQDDWSKGGNQDKPRHRLPKGGSWKIVDAIPELNAPLQKRGGWSYYSNDISAVTATASYVSAVDYTPFSAGDQVVAIDEDNRLYSISAAGTVTDKGAANVPLQRPVFHNDLLIIPNSDGTTTVKKYDGSAAPAALGGSPPTAKYAAVFRDRTVLANQSGHTTKAYFSAAANPASWDTTNSYMSALSPITGLAALPGSLLIFQKRGTARITGATPPPGSDFDMKDPLFNVGCTDARSIAVNGNYCVFANPQGIYVSNGTNLPEDLTQSAGVKKYWVELLAGYASTWTLAAGFYRDYYVISVMDGSTFKDCMMFDIPSRTVTWLTNIKATSFANAVTVGEELVWGSRALPRVNKFSSVFSPASGVKNDADGAAVTWSLESSFFQDRPGKKTWKSLYVAYDMRDAASDNPVLTVSSLKTPEGAYAALSPTLSESTDMTRARLPLRFPAEGLGVKIAQTNASSATRLYAIEAEVHARELSRLG